MAKRRSGISNSLDEVTKEILNRKPTKKPRDRSWDAARSKATYDLPEGLIKRIKEIAEELGGEGASVRISDVARLLLETGIAEYEAGNLKPKAKPKKLVLFDDDE